MAVMILAASAACLVVNSFLSGMSATEEIDELAGHGADRLAEMSSVWIFPTGHSAVFWSTVDPGPAAL